MKKNFFYAGVMAVSIIATATSCSKNEDLSAGNNDALVATGEQIITLDLQDTDVLASRSRPLHSTESKGAEEVTDVKLFVFEHQTGAEGEASNTLMTIVKVLSISTWKDESHAYNYGQQYSLKLEGENKLAKDKTYTILAVGQNESNDNVYSTPYEIFAGELTTATSIKDGTNWFVNEKGEGGLTGMTWNASSEPSKGFLLTEAKTAGDLGITHEAEIFSGISDPIKLKLDSDGGFNASVLMKRQVAGVIGYFSKIPAIVSLGTNSGEKWYNKYTAVKKIRLVAHNKNTQIDLTNSLGDQMDDATGTYEADEFIVNGFKQAEAKVKFEATPENQTEDAHIVYEIDLSKWFKVADGYSTANDASYWYGTGNSSEVGEIFFEDGLPILGENAKYAVTKQQEDDPNYGETLNTPTWSNAYDENNTSPKVDDASVLAGEFVIPFNRLQGTLNNTFELQLIGTENTNNEIILKSWNVKLDDASIDTDRGDDSYKFNVYRNHLYQIGTRTTDDPSKPGSSTGDNPQDLDKDQDLVIKINDQWDFIHDMELE